MTQLKVISWNIWGGKNLSEIIELLKKESADIICLQEVLADENESNSNAEIIAQALGLEWSYQPSTLLSPQISYLLKEQKIQTSRQWGNAILSKYHIEQHRVHTLSESHKRIALEIVVNITGNDIHFFSTHLVHTNYSPIEIQINQTKNLLNILPDKLSVVCGDFNSKPETDVIRLMEERMTNTQRPYSNGAYTYTSNSTGAKSVVDYIFCTENIKVISSGAIESDASDHLPIHAIIELK